MIKLHYQTPGFTDYPFLQKQADKYPSINADIYCEPFFEKGKPHYAIDNYRTGGSIGYDTPLLFYTQPGWGKFFEERVGRERIKCITYSIDPEFYIPVEKEKVYDIGFIGELNDPTGERSRILNLLKRKYNCYIEYGVKTKLIPEKLAKCKILFNHIRTEEVNIRFFESLYLGAQVVTHTPALNILANEGEHFLSFRNDAEMIGQIEYLLERKSAREEMAKRSHELVLKRHTTEHRMKDMVSML